MSPVIAFYGILAITAVNLPLRDDCDTILSFANGLADITTFQGKFAFFLDSQSNEYKLYVLHAFVWIQTALFHHVNFRVLIGIGDVFILPLGYLLWKQFLPNGVNVRQRLVYFFPVVCLLFQLRYQETADWSTAALQHLPCLFFSFASLYLVRAGSGVKFGVSLLLMALAIGSSGNGFVLIPVGLLALVMDRQRVRTLGWSAMGAACAMVYFHHYTRVNLQAKQPLLASLLHLRFTYLWLFIGSIAARPFIMPGIVLGFMICVALVYFALAGSLHRKSNTLYNVLYLLLTALVVAAFRDDVDALQISTSRYTIYSALLLIFCWFLTVEHFTARDGAPRVPRPLQFGVTVTVALFACSTYISGIHAIQHTDRTLVEGITAYEHPGSGVAFRGPIVPLPTDNEAQKIYLVRSKQELDRSVQLGLFTPQ